MKARINILICLLMFMFNLRAQNSIQDLKDSVRVKEFISSAAKLAEKPDSQLFFAKKAMELSIKIN
ncbi:MAG: hypothetical protein IPG08_04100 [Sphingobacteriaceae bacterium]|nr:hypothetical protein [Sphingobacteriaceae bacterium]